MKIITMTIGPNGEVQVSDLNLGKIGEHLNTKLILESPDGFFEGADYFRMSFGSFESNELNVTDGTIEYLIPSGATGSAVKSWQLTGYKFEGELAVKVKKTQMVIFSLDQSISGEEALRNKYIGSIEADIQRYKQALNQANEMYNHLTEQLDGYVKTEDGKGLSSNDYTDADKQAVAAAASALPYKGMINGGLDALTDSGIYTLSIYATSSAVKEFFGGILFVSAQGDVGGSNGTYQYILGGKYSYYRYSVDGTWCPWKNSNTNSIAP